MLHAARLVRASSALFSSNAAGGNIRHGWQMAGAERVFERGGAAPETALAALAKHGSGSAVACANGKRG